MSLSSAVLLVSCFVAQAEPASPAPTDPNAGATIADAPAAEVIDEEFLYTQSKAKVLRESLRVLDQINAELQQLGDPAKKEPGETVPEYFQRVRSIFTKRAQYLVVLRLEYEKALQTRYELEVDLNEFTRTLQDREKKRKTKYLETDKLRDRLETRFKALQRESFIVCDMLATDLEDEIKKLAAKTPLSEEQVRQRETCKKEVAQLQFARARIIALGNQAEIRGKYSGKSAAQLREELRKLENQIKDTKFEYNYVSTRVLNESRIFQEEWGRRCEEIIKDANAMMLKTRDMEDRAAAVAIMSKYVRDDLDAIGAALTITNLHAKLNEILEQEKDRAPYVDRILGVEPVLSSNVQLQSLLTSPLETPAEKSPSDTPGQPGAAK